MDDEVNDDAELMARVASGDDRACTELFRRHHARAVAEARSTARTHEAADDAAAAAFQSVFTALRDGRNIDHFRSYLLTSVRNRVISQSRSRSSTEVPTDQTADTVDDSFLDAAQQRLGAAMNTAFDALPPRQRQALWSAEVEEASNAEIGEQLDIKANAVAALTMRARRTLRDAYIAEMTAGADIHDWVLQRADALPLSVENQMVVDFHLGDCSGCAAIVGERRPVRTAGFIGAALLLAGVSSPLAAPTPPPSLAARLGVRATRVGARSKAVVTRPVAWVGGTAVVAVVALGVATTFASPDDRLPVGPAESDVDVVVADLELGPEPTSDDPTSTTSGPLAPTTTAFIATTTSDAPTTTTTATTTTTPTTVSGRGPDEIASTTTAPQRPTPGGVAATTTTTLADSDPTPAAPPSTTATTTAPTTTRATTTTASPTTTTTTTTVPATTTTTSTTTTTTTTTTSTTTTTTSTTTTTTTTTTVPCGQQNPPTC